jgi:hypothetical protein
VAVARRGDQQEHGQQVQAQLAAAARGGLGEPQRGRRVALLAERDRQVQLRPGALDQGAGVPGQVPGLQHALGWPALQHLEPAQRHQRVQPLGGQARRPGDLGLPGERRHRLGPPARQVQRAPLQVERGAGGRRVGRVGRRPPVQRPDQVRQCGRQHRLAEHRVAELDLPGPGLQQPGVQGGRDRLADRVRGLLGDRGEQAGLEAAEHRAGDHHRPLGGAEPPQASADQVGDGAGHRPGAAAPAHAGVVDGHRAAAHVRREHLLDQQRDPVGPRHHVVDQRRRRRRAQQRAEQLGDLQAAERFQLPQLGGAVARQPPDRLLGDARLAGAERGGDHHPPGRRRGEVAERPQALGVGGVQVVEPQQRPGGARRRRLHQPDEPLERQQPQLRVGQAAAVPARPLRQDQAQPGRERPERLLLDGVGAQPGAQRLGHRAERHRGDGGPPARQHHQPGAAGGGRHLGQQPRLADPSLAQQERARRPATGRLAYPPAQPLQLDLAPHDHRRAALHATHCASMPAR